MDSETWKSFCKAAGEQKGYVMATDRPLEANNFQCDKCEMIWRTIMKLEGEPHRALQNKCGGTWRAYIHVPTVKAKGEEYEVDE